jgi:hypothetical protein
MIDKQKQNLNMKVQWAKFAVVLALYLLFLIWVESWLGLIVVPFIFDVYITKKIHWQWWKDEEGPIRIDGAADVQNHVVVSLIFVVGMKIPVARLVVNLHVAHPQRTVNLDFSVEEIGPCIAIVQSGVDDFHLPVVGGGKRGEWEEFVLPHIVK